MIHRRDSDIREPDWTYVNSITAQSSDGNLSDSLHPARLSGLQRRAALSGTRTDDELRCWGSILLMGKEEERRPIHWMRTIGERSSSLSMVADPRLHTMQPQSTAQGVTPWALQSRAKQDQGHDPMLDLYRRPMRSHMHTFRLAFNLWWTRPSWLGDRGWRHSPM